MGELIDKVYVDSHNCHSAQTGFAVLQPNMQSSPEIQLLDGFIIPNAATHHLVIGPSEIICNR